VEEIYTNETTGGNKMKKYTKYMKNEKGMTLIELLAVIVIIAIIAAIAVPAIGGIINNSRDKALLADASNILAGAKIANVDGACGLPTATGVVECKEVDLKKYVENVKTGTTYKANYDGTAWTVTYSGLTDIKSKDYQVGSPVTESKLNEVMQGKIKATTP